MRTIVVGDIHGCCQALLGLLELIAPSSRDTLVFLGDYVDRGPDSQGVIATLVRLRLTCQTICLLGNHELMFRGALSGLDPNIWLRLGGQETLDSYGGSLKDVPVEHLEFLHDCVPWYETDENLFVHANYLPNLPLAEQPETTLFWEHLSHGLPAPHYSGKIAFCGHTPQLDGEIADFGHLICLDTNCYGGGWLSGVDVASGAYWQVDFVGKLRKELPNGGRVHSLSNTPTQYRDGKL